MTTATAQTRVRAILATAILLTTAAELFYLVVWGMWLFLAGSWAAKTIWTQTCGLAMGAVIGAATLVWAEPAGRVAGFWIAAASVAVVGSYCAWLCSRIDSRLGLFGGAENTGLFVVAGAIPAVAGGALYGWLLYRRNAPAAV